MFHIWNNCYFQVALPIWVSIDHWHASTKLRLSCAILLLWFTTHFKVFQYMMNLDKIVYLFQSIIIIEWWTCPCYLTCLLEFFKLPDSYSLLMMFNFLFCYYYTSLKVHIFCRDYLAAVKSVNELQEFLLALQDLQLKKVLRSIELRLQLYAFLCVYKYSAWIVLQFLKFLDTNLQYLSSRCFSISLCFIEKLLVQF